MVGAFQYASEALKEDEEFMSEVFKFLIPPQKEIGMIPLKPSKLRLLRLYHLIKKILGFKSF